MRIACVVIPRFPLAVELLAQPELRGRPVVIGGAPDERKAVVVCSPEAEREGVRRGMPLRQARALCRDAVFIEARHGLYRECHTRMLDALDQISPVIEDAGLGCAYAGVDGLRPLLGDEQTIAGIMVESVRSALRLRPRVGLAESRFAAWAATLAARAGDTRILEPGAAAAYLATLPVEHLPVSAAMLERLRWLGLRTMADLTALPRGTLAAQFGPEGALAWDLARGDGGAPLTPRRPAEEVRGQIAFPQPAAGVQAIVAAARHLLARLLARPECAGRAVRGLLLSLVLQNGHRWERVLTFREPVTDRDRLLRALAARLDGITLPAAAEALILGLRDLCGETGIQGSLFTAQRHSAGLGTALAQLRSRFGRDLVMQIVEVEPWSRLPERRYALAAVRPPETASGCSTPPSRSR
jgi:nucleotidyltransferase/DNA polymerase involved in DNA repair